jgi:dGTPase
MNEEFQEAMNELRSFMFKNVYLSSVAKKDETKAQNIIKELYRYIIKTPELLPQEMAKMLDVYDIDRVVCDYVAGMTDRYAVKKFNDIFIPASWN